VAPAERARIFEPFVQLEHGDRRAPWVADSGSRSVGLRSKRTAGASGSRTRSLERLSASPCRCVIEPAARVCNACRLERAQRNPCIERVVNRWLSRWRRSCFGNEYGRDFA
jgi:hypothetical protein